MSQPLKTSAVVAIALLSTLVGCLGISTESLWIDEAATFGLAANPTLHDWVAAMWRNDSSDGQMPLYMLYMWAWVKTIGAHPEWIFRASNVIWLVLAQLALCFGLRRWPMWAAASAVTLGFHPFVWAYISEARPYIMQLAGAMLVTCFFVQQWNEKTSSQSWMWGLGGGLLILCGSSLLGVLWAGSALLLLGGRWLRGDILLRRSQWMILGAVGLLLVGLGAYYLHTFSLHAAPTPGTTDLKNVAFAFYELFGCSGLGPSRNAIREQGLVAFHPFLFSILLGASVFTALIAAGARKFALAPQQRWNPALLAWFSPIVLLFVLGALKDSRVLGRHLMPAFPAFILLTGAALGGFWSSPHRRWLAPVCGLPFLLSALLLRTAPRHAKEDSRAGLAVLREMVAQGQRVWWGGDAALPRYYGLDLHLPQELAEGPQLIRNESFEAIAFLPAPDAILLLRPDNFDLKAGLRHWLGENPRYAVTKRWPGLALWQDAGGAAADSSRKQSMP